MKREDLTEEQKQTISGLSTLAAGLAGGLAGGNTEGAVAGAQAGKNAVENNALSNKDKLPVNVLDINPMLKIEVEDANGYPLKGGGGIGNRPANMSPEGAGRNGAFREAKRESGIPATQ